MPSRGRYARQRQDTKERKGRSTATPVHANPYAGHNRTTAGQVERRHVSGIAQPTKQTGRQQADYVPPQRIAPSKYTDGSLRKAQKKIRNRDWRDMVKALVLAAVIMAFVSFGYRYTHLKATDTDDGTRTESILTTDNPPVTLPEILGFGDKSGDGNGSTTTDADNGDEEHATHGESSLGTQIPFSQKSTTINAGDGLVTLDIAIGEYDDDPNEMDISMGMDGVRKGWRGTLEFLDVTGDVIEDADVSMPVDMGDSIQSMMIVNVPDINKVNSYRIIEEEPEDTNGNGTSDTSDT